MKSIYRKKAVRSGMAAVLAWCAGQASAQTNFPTAGVTETNVTQLGNTTVVGHLNEARSAIVPDLGATAYTLNQQQILTEVQGGNGGFNQAVLRAPGVAQDSEGSGQLHVRGEHANLQYRINDVLLPEGISGFGLELDPRFVDSFQLITGSLPAEYGFRTAGIVDIQTKTGLENGGEAGVYGGSFDTVRPYAEFGGTEGKWTFYGDTSFEHTGLGIENPTSSYGAIHDNSDQYRSFLYGSYLIDASSRLTLMAGASYSTFELPDTQGLAPGTAPGGAQWLPGTFDSSKVDENQIEQNYYGILSYQKSAGDLNYQLSAYGRSSRVHFEPDLLGDLFFNGEASDVARNLYSGGLQLDASYQLGDYHTVRGGFMFLDEYVADNSLTGVFPLGATGNPSGPAFNIPDNQVLHGIFAGAYLQDEWKILPQVTLNYGARFDEFYSSFDHENQISPRVNLIYQPTASTTLHAGYSRYFTPPPPEAVFSPNFTAYNGTSGSTGSTVNSPPKAERANYFDAGISQKLNRNLTLGLDGYYKSARNQLDDGLFGQSLVLDTFNYTQGLIYGVEATASYNQGGFSAYANLAYSIARGKNWSSSQFLFGADGPGTDLNYVRNNWIYLDHDQRVSGSFGVSYTWKQARGRTTVYCDALYGSGLRTDAAAADGSNIPNGGSLPHYWTVNMGVEQMFRWSGHDHLRARLDVENVSDNTYELRDGSGVGVNAAQFGQRAGFFGTLSYLF